MKAHLARTWKRYLLGAAAVVVAGLVARGLLPAELGAVLLKWLGW